MNKQNDFVGVILLISTITFFSILSTSCYKDNEEELYRAICDTTNVSYSSDVESIIQNYCYACHGSTIFSTLGGNVELESYTKFVIYVDNGRLLKAIKHEASISPMPQNSPKLSDCAINTIEAWVNQGAINN